jgi:hypothetical protein
MLKKCDIDIILKEWDNMARKNYILAASDIQSPFGNDEISAKAMYNACRDQARTPTAKTIS